MMINDVVRAVSGAVVLLALASCGGGGDIAGDSSEFAVSPKENKLELGPGSNCADASVVPPIVVTIIGGQPPFRIVNSSPEALVVDKTEATGKDPQFKVSYYRNAVVCVNPGTITVLDYHSRVASFEYSVEIKEATSP
jgi:hypothetical protein